MFAVLSASPLAFALLAGVVGLLVGSFLNVVIHRLPIMLERAWTAEAAEFRGEPVPETTTYNLFVPRSTCPSCARPVRAHENIPLLGWLMLRARCAGCGARISARYPVVELLGGVLAAACAWKFGFGLAGLAAIGFSWALIALTFIDADTQLLPDEITLPLLWAGLLVNLDAAFVALPDAVIGAAAGYLVLWSIYWLFRLTTGREGMGYGDFKLLAALGAWLGWKMLPIIILLSSVVGAVVGIGLMVFARHGREQPIPFGPYLAGAGVLALFFGPAINAAWLGIG
ncbi:prepilin peptidase [Derxia lacustris]|uniref:prepilin peptidase n=1 Tax=Derxia lacustris TaxID=764842 RepID=UPI00111BF726|nr:A24 family peptidase [Derxia lacustris]